MKPNLFSPIYYLLTFLYMSVAIFLSFFKLPLNIINEPRFRLKVGLIFFVTLIILMILFPNFYIYFFAPLVFCTVVFIFADRNTFYAEGKFNYYYNNERWNNVVKAGRDWFIFGLITSFLALLVAVIQVQVFQGGMGGINQEYTRCIEYSADGTSCLLESPVTQLIGSRLATLITWYGGQAFIWGGLFFVLVKHGGKISRELMGSIQNIGKNFPKKNKKII